MRPYVGLERPVPLIGFHGKVPTVDHFVQRRLTAQFAKPWQRAASIGMAGCARTLGEGWHDAFLAMPRWRFALLPGVCGATSWVGVVSPSMDRLSRAFPLVLAAPLSLEGPAGRLVPADSWFDALDVAANRARDGMSVTLLDSLIALLPSPVAAPKAALPGRVSAKHRSVWWTGTETREVVGLAGLPDELDFHLLVTGALQS